MREQLQKLISEWRNEYKTFRRSDTVHESWAFGYAAKELEAILAANPEPAVKLRPGFVCKDAAGSWWSENAPYWVTSVELWEMLSGSAYQWIAISMNDPWPDKPNGGPECLMEVR